LKHYWRGGVNHELSAKAEQMAEVSEGSVDALLPDDDECVPTTSLILPRQTESGVDMVTNTSGVDGLMYVGNKMAQVDALDCCGSSFEQCLACNIDYLSRLQHLYKTGALLTDAWEWHWVQLGTAFGGRIQLSAMDDILTVAKDEGAYCLCTTLTMSGPALTKSAAGLRYDLARGITNYRASPRMLRGGCLMRERLACKMNEVLVQQLRAASGGLEDRLREWNSRQYFVGAYLSGERGLPLSGPCALRNPRQFSELVRLKFVRVSQAEASTLTELALTPVPELKNLKIAKLFSDFQSAASSSQPGPRPGTCTLF
jgi:hypothetical protein